MNYERTDTFCLLFVSLVIFATGIYMALYAGNTKDYAPGDMNVRVDPMTCIEYMRFSNGDYAPGTYVMRVDRNGKPVLFGPCVDGK